MSESSRWERRQRRKHNRQKRKNLSTEQPMSFRDAMALVPDHLPDGAYWAMAHEIAGLDYGDGFDELAEEEAKEKADVS